MWQRLEDDVVQPLVYGKALHVNPLVTIISLLVGAELLGILGVLLVIPSAAAIQIILREWWSARGLDAPGLGAGGVRGEEGPTRTQSRKTCDDRSPIGHGKYVATTRRSDRPVAETTGEEP